MRPPGWAANQLAAASAEAKNDCWEQALASASSTLFIFWRTGARGFNTVTTAPVGSTSSTPSSERSTRIDVPVAGHLDSARTDAPVTALSGVRQWFQVVDAAYASFLCTVFSFAGCFPAHVALVLALRAYRSPTHLADHHCSAPSCSRTLSSRSN